jgi:phosphate starvation-inducible PhoH-like protein
MREAFSFHFEPRNQAQREFVRLYHENTITLALGPAGSGKTFLACACALSDIRANKAKKLILIRPAIEAGEKLGALPGSVEEKLDPFQAPFHHVLGKMAFRLPKDILETQSIAHLRGLTFENCVAVVDEAQNLTLSQLRLVLSRLGPGAKICLCGDPEQSDIKSNVLNYTCDFDYVADRLADCPHVAVFDFTDADIVRHPLINQILKRL